MRILMVDCYISSGEIKRKIRNLKKLELKIRFHIDNFQESNSRLEMLSKENNIKLVWDEFFDLHENSSKEVRFPLKKLLNLNREDLKNIISEFYYRVFYQYYKDNGMFNMSLYDPDILSQLGLPYDADINAIKKRFRELAKLYHPDAGGDEEKFIELLEQFEALGMK